MKKIKDTVLFYALKYGQLNIAKLLIDKGADVNVKDSSGDTALLRAASEGQVDLVKLLIDKGADVNANNFSGDTALLRAAREGQVDVVKLLIDKGVDVNANNFSGDTALLRAVREGQVDVVKLLIDKGADVNANNFSGDTALLRAARKGQVDLVKLLIDKGADVNVKDYFGTALLRAASEGQVDLVKLLIDKGADVNANNFSGDTALLRAAMQGHDKIVKTIVKAGADLSVTNDQDANIMTYYHDQPEMVELLISYGLDYEIFKEQDITLINMVKSSQSSHDTDLIGKLYSHLMDDDTKSNLQNKYSKQYTSQLQSELKKIIGNHKNLEFKSLFLELVKQKLADYQNNIGQGESFIEQLLKASESEYDIAKIKNNEVEANELIKQIDTFVRSDNSKKYFGSLIKSATAIQDTLHQQDQITINGNIIKTNLIIPLIQKIAAEDQKSSEDIMNRLAIELIDAATMYGSGGSSCVKGILNKLATILIDRIDDNNDQNKVALFSFEGYVVNYNELLEAALKLEDDHNINIKQPLNELNAQKMRSFIYKILKTDLIPNEQFSTIVYYGETENIFANNDSNIELFHRELTYKLLSEVQKQILVKNNSGTYTIPEAFHPVVDDDNHIEAYKNDISKHILLQAIVAKLRDLQDAYNDPSYEVLIEGIKLIPEPQLKAAEHLNAEELVQYLGEIVNYDNV